MSNEVKIIETILNIADKAPTHIKEFANYVEGNIDSVLNNLESYNIELANKISDLSYVKEKFKCVADAGYNYLDCIDDFYYYGKDTDFESIIKDIRNSKKESLLRFLREMDGWLCRITTAYRKYIKKCNDAVKHCTKCAESCAAHQAKARSNKNKTRVVGGTTSALGFATGIVGVAVGIGGVAVSVVAGTVTLGVGTVVGLSLTAVAVGGIVGAGATTVTVITAHEFKKAETSFRSLDSNFRESTNQATKLKGLFDDIKSAVNKYERYNSYAHHYASDWNDVKKLCRALESMQLVLQSRRVETAEAVSILKEKIN